MPDETWIRLLIAYVAVAYLILWVALIVFVSKWILKIAAAILIYPYVSWKMLYKLNKEKMRR